MVAIVSPPPLPAWWPPSGYEELTAWLKEHGLGVWVWTVNDPERARTCAAWEVIGICTDDPALLQQALSQ